MAVHKDSKHRQSGCLRAIGNPLQRGYEQKRPKRYCAGAKQIDTSSSGQ